MTILDRNEHNAQGNGDWSFCGETRKLPRRSAPLRLVWLSIPQYIRAEIESRTLAGDEERPKEEKGQPAAFLETAGWQFRAAYALD